MAQDPAAASPPPALLASRGRGWGQAVVGVGLRGGAGPSHSRVSQG